MIRQGEKKSHAVQSPSHHQVPVRANDTTQFYLDNNRPLTWIMLGFGSGPFLARSLNQKDDCETVKIVPVPSKFALLTQLSPMFTIAN